MISSSYSIYVCACVCVCVYVIVSEQLNYFFYFSFIVSSHCDFYFLPYDVVLFMVCALVPVFSFWILLMKVFCEMSYYYPLMSNENAPIH